MLFFVLFLAIICVFIYALYRIIAHKKYVYAQSPSHMRDKTQENQQNEEQDIKED